MKITHLRNLLLAVACLFAGVSAQAQFSGSVEQYPTNDWSGSPIVFSLSEVAEALGTDAGTVGTAIDTYVNSDAPETLLFSAVVDGSDVAWTAATTAANNGFWMTMTGQPVSYGEESVFYASPEADLENGELIFYVGQMPDVMQPGQTATATLKLTFNEKSVTFQLALNVIAKPVFEIPEPTTLLEKSLNVVGEIETVVEQYPRGGYDSDVVKVYLAPVLTALGIDNKDMVAQALDQLLFATEYNTGTVEEGGGLKKDSVTNATTAGGIGWWMRPVQNENGEETGECSSAGWGDTDRFFVENFAYTADDDSLTCYLGQYPGTCKDNEQYFTNLYMVYGDKAYRLKYTLKLLEKEQGTGMSTYTKVGEESVTVEQEPLTDWAAVQAKPDLDAIATALGCEVDAIGLVALDDKDNFGASTANNGGWWLNEDGRVVAYSNGAFYVEPATAGDYSVLNVGQMINKYQVGDELKTSLYFTNADKYYQYNITLKIVEPQLVEYNFESVETRNFTVQVQPAADYTEVEFATVSLENIESLIGTTSPTLYGLNIDSVAVVKGTYSSAYSCDPKPGFWLNEEGCVSVWGDANAKVAVGFKPATGVFYHNQKPNAMSVGDVFKTQMFLVNEDNDKMITFNITLNFVESLEEKEVVGEENITLPITPDEATIPLDLTKPAEALGVTVADLLNESNYYLRGMKDGVYGAGQTTSNGLAFNMLGAYDEYGDIYLTIDPKDDGAELTIGCNNAVADDFTTNAQFCFEVENKQYVYYAKFVSPAIFAGITTVENDAQRNAPIFDLSGRRVLAPVNGIYIQNSKKVVIK